MSRLLASVVLLAACARGGPARSVATPETCGDGIRSAGEICDGADLGGNTCASAGFSGGTLHCTPACFLDTASCFRVEDCKNSGDEDGNGLADCADPACLEDRGCFVLSALDPPDYADVSSAVTLRFRASDGAGRPLPGRVVTLEGPPGAAVARGTFWSDADGQASIPVRLGRMPGRALFEAKLEGITSASVAIDVGEPPSGTVLSILDADRLAGGDSSGPAAGAHVGPPIGVQVAADGTLYVAEACRVLAVSPEGELGLVLGTGVCGTAPDDADPLSADVTVSGIALSGSVLYVADPAAGLVRGLELATGRMTAVAGGGTVTGSDADGGPASAASLRPSSVAPDPSGKILVRDDDSATFRGVNLDTGIIDTEFPVADWNCSTAGRASACKGTCSVTWDPAGSPFVAGVFDAAYPGGGWLLFSEGPGIARYDASDGSFRVVAGREPGPPPTGGPAGSAQFASIAAEGFDAGGNLFLASGNALYRIDGTTALVEKVAGGEPALAGDDGPVSAALFHSPSGLAFGPGGDLYVADTGNGLVRRIVGLGSSTPTMAVVQPLAGDISGYPAQRVALPFQVTDAAGMPVADLLPAVVTDDTAMLVPEQPSTDDSGQGTGSLVLGLRPGMARASVYLSGIHQAPSGTPGRFTVQTVEPPRGTLLTVQYEGDAEPWCVRPTPVPVAGASSSFFTDVARSPDGTLYLSDGNSIMRMDDRGFLTSVYGPGQGFFTGFAFRDAATLLVSDWTSVRAVDLPTGKVTNVAGVQGPDGAGDGGPATAASFGSLFALTVEADGSIDLSDGTQGVRRIDGATGTIRNVLPTTCTPAGRSIAGEAEDLAADGSTLWMAAATCDDSGRSGMGVARLDADGTLTNFDIPAYAVLPEPDGTVLVCGWEVDRLDPATGSVTKIADRGGWSSPVDMARDRDGHLWLALGDMLQVLW